MNFPPRPSLRQSAPRGNCDARSAHHGFIVDHGALDADGAAIMAANRTSWSSLSAGRFERLDFTLALPELYVVIINKILRVFLRGVVVGTNKLNGPDKVPIVSDEEGSIIGHANEYHWEVPSWNTLTVRPSVH
jgi:hypothetical protein